MNPRQDLEHTLRFVFEKYHESSFDGRTARFDAGDFLDNDGCVGRKFQDRLNPVTDLVKDESRDIQFAAERIDFGRAVSVFGDKTIFKSSGNFFTIQGAADKTQPVCAFLPLGPLAPWPALKQKVHALKVELV